MNLDHEIDYTQRAVLVTITGAMSDRDLLDLATKIEQWPGIRSDFSILFDLRFADGQNVTAEGVRAIAARPLILSPESRRGIVDRKSTRLNSSHSQISYAVFCLKK